MADDGISDEIKAFIAEYFNSVEQLEVLLLVLRTAPREWTDTELSKELYISPEAAADRLLYFHNLGFLVVSEHAERSYRYQPTNSRLDRLTRGLEEAYNQRRVRIINLIYSNPLDRIRSFADAFKFRKDEN